MSAYENKLDSMLFDHETMMRTSYRGGKIKPKVETVYKEKPSCVFTRPPPLKDIHTMTEWKKPSIPFELFANSNPVLRKDPRIIQQPYEKPPDLCREESQKTRPRLVMTPAVSLDDVEDKRKRDILIADTYVSQTHKALSDVTARSKSENVRAPLPGPYSPSNPITLQKLQPPYVSPEWRKQSVSWDNEQLRAFTHTDKLFWLDRTPKCQVCDETAARELRRKMKIRKNLN